MKKGVIITDTAEIQRTTRDHCQRACAAETDSLGNGQALGKVQSPKQNQEETEKYEHNRNY